MSFEAAVEHASVLGLEIGFSIDKSDPFACIDIDIKPDQNGASTFQTEILRWFSSYTERSSGGLGYHIWVLGAVGLGVRANQVEMYSQARFMVCTGDVVNASPIRDYSMDLVQLANYMRPTQLAPAAKSSDEPDFEVDDEDVVEHAALLLPNFDAVWAGQFEDLFESGSHADFALLTTLARVTPSDAQCIRIFANSGLGRRVKDGKVKWNRPDYRASTMASARAAAQATEKAISHGREQADRLLTRLEGTKAASRPRQHQAKVHLLTDTDLSRLPASAWLVKGVIPAQGIGTVFGPSGSYKSFGVLHLLACIANGLPWFGHRVVQAPAVYLVLEGQSGIPKRTEAWRAEHAVSANSTSIKFIFDQLNLRRSEDRRALVTALKEAGAAGGILCIDTLAQSGPGIDENSSEGMGEMIAAFHEIQADLGGVVMAVHHTGKTEGRGPRGWSGLFAAMDFAIEFGPKADAPLSGFFAITKSKDDASGSRQPFQLRRHVVGRDADGDDITSLAMISMGIPFTPATRVDPNSDASLVEAWIREEIAAGKQPTGASLEARQAITRALTQARLRLAIKALLDSNRIKRLARSRNGNPWLAPSDYVEQKEDHQ